jgi:hypothetical protein
LSRIAQPAPKPAHLFFHVREFDREDGRGEVSKLACWGLVREVENIDTKKRASGLWMITPFGSQFVRKQVLVPKYILLRWGTDLLGFAGPEVGILDCLGDKFDYTALMNR